jgi:hypothetical protein
LVRRVCPGHLRPDPRRRASDLEVPIRLPFGNPAKTNKTFRITGDRRARCPGDAATDGTTLTYRTAQLVEHIEGLTNKKEPQTLLKSLPINDVSYIRNCINDPPFGVDTDVEIICPMCLHEFKVDMPPGSKFFLPPTEEGQDASLTHCGTYWQKRFFFFQYHMKLPMAGSNGLTNQPTEMDDRKVHTAARKRARSSWTPPVGSQSRNVKAAKTRLFPSRK